ncbi:hypothetical protein ACFL4D_02475 [Candidatus Margulisiibacteriota bacterium]
MNKKIINKFDLEQHKSKRAFCDTPLSRIHLRGKTAQVAQIGIPAFNNIHFGPDVSRINLRARARTRVGKFRDFTSFIKDIKQFIDTYLYPSTVISLVLVDDNKKPIEVHNAETLASVSRTIEDWAINDTNSIANWALAAEPGTLLSIPNTDPANLTGFYKVPENLYEILTTKEDSKEAEEKAEKLNMAWQQNYVHYDSITEISNYGLIRKEIPTPPHDGVAPVCSAILAPLWYNGKLLGALLIGNDFYRSYTSDVNHLTEQHLMNVQQLITTVAMTVNHLNSLQEEKRG